MKVGIVTILKADNFGAELQAYATQRKLQLMGYDAEIIDYLYFKHADFRYTKNARPLWEQGLRIRFCEFVKYRILNKILSKVIPVFVPAQKKFYQRFMDFHARNTRMSRCYRTIEDLYQNPPLYDTYIVGSDQVWNPGTGASLAPYFLTFAPTNSKKISYASSFGVSKIQEVKKLQYKEWLNGLDTISVREDAGVKLVKEISGRDASLVLDPTLLLTKEEWTLLKPNYNLTPGYVLIYEGDRSETLIKIAKRYAKEYNVKIYRIEYKAIMNKKDKGIINLVDCGPEDFVKLIENAGLVLTGSFHGTAFSVNMGVPFFSVLKRSVGNNSRITSLLNIVGLNDRIVYEDDDVDILQWSSYDVDKVQNILGREREKSINYLRNSLDA